MAIITGITESWDNHSYQEVENFIKSDIALLQKGTGENSIEQVNTFTSSEGKNSISTCGVESFLYHPGEPDERTINVSNKTIASGISSFSTGIATKATGEGSHSEGHMAIRNDSFSVASITFNEIIYEYEGKSSGNNPYSWINGTSLIYTKTGYPKIGENVYVNETSETPLGIISNRETVVVQDTLFTEASGRGSHAEGLGTKSMNSGSHSEGIGSIAAGGSNHSEGYYTETISGEGAHVEGMYSRAQGNATHSEGYETATRGTAAHAEGRRTNALQYGAHSEGGYVKENDSKLVIYNDNNIIKCLTGNPIVGTAYKGIKISSYNSTTKEMHFDDDETILEWIGEKNTLSIYPSTTATGTSSHAEGSMTVASGNAAHAEGKQTLASGAQSHAEGLNTIASGPSSHVEGESNTAGGDSDHVEGYLNKVNGVCNHVEGRENTVTGIYNHVSGKKCIVSGDFNLIHEITEPIKLVGPSMASNSKQTMCQLKSYNEYIRILVAVGSYFYHNGTKYTITTIYSGDNPWFKISPNPSFSGTISNLTIYSDSVTINEVNGNNGTYSISSEYPSNISSSYFIGLYNEKYNIIINSINFEEHEISFKKIDGTSFTGSITTEDLVFYPIAYHDENNTVSLNSFKINNNGDVFVKGLGGFTGKNEASAVSLQNLIWKGTQAQYDAISSKNPNIIYLIFE